jgi:hypothetical protein
MTQRRGNFMEVEGVGMGCTLIRRDVITAMLSKFPELIDGRISLQPYFKILQSAGANRLLRVFDKMNVENRGWVSEDLSFCIRWRMCGGQVWAAVGYRISHVGPYDYGACYLEHVTQQEAVAQQQAAMQKAIEDQQRAAVEQSLLQVIAIPADQHVVTLPGGQGVWTNGGMTVVAEQAPQEVVAIAEKTTKRKRGNGKRAAR